MRKRARFARLAYVEPFVEGFAEGLTPRSGPVARGYRRPDGRFVPSIAGGSPAAGTIPATEHYRSDVSDPAAGAQAVPFARASYQYREKMRADAFTLTAAQQTPAAIPIIPGGFLRGVWLEVAVSVSGALGTAVLGSPTDFPYSLIASLTLEDVNGQAIVGPISGYEVYLANKYGGYFFAGDPTVNPAFTGTFASPYFILWVPLEVRSDAFGSLANTDARAQYRLTYTIDASSNILSTGTITTPLQFTVTSWVDYWAQVEKESMAGDPQEQTPPYVGSTQFWYRELPVVAAGAQTVKHNRVGNAIRTIIYELRNGVAAGGAQPANQRVTNYTDPVKLRLDNRYLFSESPNLRRRGLMGRQYDLSGPDGDPATIGTPAVGILETGTYVVPFSRGLDYHPSPADEGNWLDTNEAQFLQLEVTYTGTVASQTIVTNDVAPPAPRG